MILNAVIVAVALPSIQRDLGLDAEGLTWVVNVYLLMAGGFLLLGGRSADLIGRKVVFISGVSIFSAASLACGLASGPAILLAGRLLQGLGAAVVVPATLSILTTSFADGPPRRRVLAIWGGVNAVTSGGALLLGGVLTTVFSWSAIFFLNSFLGVAVVAAAVVYLRKGARIPAGKIDFGGALTLTGGSLALVFATINGRQQGWLAASTVMSTAIAVLLLGAFLAIEKVHETPLIRLGIFRMRTLATANMVVSVVTGITTTALYVMTLYFQQVLGYSPLRTGMAFLPAAAVSLAGSLAAHVMIKRLGFRPVLLGSLALISVGSALHARISIAGNYSHEVLPAVVVMYFGLGCAGVTLIILATARVREADAGLAAGLFSTSERIGAAFWLAAFTSVSAVKANSHIVTRSEQLESLEGFQATFLAIAILVAVAVPTVGLILRRSGGLSEEGQTAIRGKRT